MTIETLTIRAGKGRVYGKSLTYERFFQRLEVKTFQHDAALFQKFHKLLTPTRPLVLIAVPEEHLGSHLFLKSMGYKAVSVDRDRETYVFHYRKQFKNAKALDTTTTTPTRFGLVFKSEQKVMLAEFVDGSVQIASPISDCAGIYTDLHPREMSLVSIRPERNHEDGERIAIQDLKTITIENLNDPSTTIHDLIESGNFLPLAKSIYEDVVKPQLND